MGFGVGFELFFDGTEAQEDPVAPAPAYPGAVGNAALHAALAAAVRDRQVDMLQEYALSSRQLVGDTTLFVLVRL